MNLKLLAWDSEMVSSVGMPNPYKDPILIISLATESESKLLILTDEEYAKKDDRRIIQEFIKYIYDFDPDIIMGYNCFSSGTEIITEDFDILKIEDFIKNNNSANIIGFQDNKIKPVNVFHRYKYNTKENIIRIKTASGKSISVTFDQQFLTGLNWTKSKDLHVGNYIATPRNMFGNDSTFDFIDFIDENRYITDSEFLDNLLITSKKFFGKEYIARYRRSGLKYQYRNYVKNLEILLGINSYTIKNNFYNHKLKIKDAKKIISELRLDWNTLKTSIKEVDNFELPKISENLFYFAGIVSSDGHLDLKRKTISNNRKRNFDSELYIANTNKKIIDFSFSFLNKFSNPRISIKKKNSLGHKDLYILDLSCGILKDFLNFLGLPNGNRHILSYNLRNILKFENKYIGAYLAGYFDGDGTKKHHSISCTVGNVLEDLQLLFTKLGIVTYHERQANHIYIIKSNINAEKIAEYINPFILTQKIDFIDATSPVDKLPQEFGRWFKAERIINDIGRYSFSIPPSSIFEYENKRGIPINAWRMLLSELEVLTGNNYERIRNLSLNENIFWDKIVEIKYDIVQDVYDLNTSSSNFIANGIICHNSDKFDFPYIQKRAELHGMALKLGRDGSEIRFSRSGLYETIDIIGRLNVDLYKVVRKELQEVKVKKLENVAEYLDVRAKSERINLTPREIGECWANKSNRYALYQYALDDAESTLGIGLKLLPAQIDLARLIGMPLDESVDASRGQQSEQYLLRAAYKRNDLVPYGGKSEATYAGALVLKPNKGLFKDIIDIDFASQYPTLVIKYNISPDTYISSDETEDIEDVNIIPELNHRFKKYPKGLFPSVMEELIEHRKELKNKLKLLDRDSEEHKLLDIQQYNLKILNNCFSGDTKILTKDGFKFVKDCKVGEYVYSLNQSTYNLELIKIIETQQQFSENINEIKTHNGINFLATDNHRFFVSSSPETKPFFATIKEIKNGRIRRAYIPAHNKWNGLIQEYFSLWDFAEEYEIIFKSNEKSCHKFEITKNPIFKHSGTGRYYKIKKSNIKNPAEFENIYNGKLYLKAFKNSKLCDWKINIKDLMELCGWYLSEGTLHYNSANLTSWKSRRGEAFIIDIVQKKYKRELENLLIRLQNSGFIHSIRNKSDSGVYVYSISNKFLYKTLEHLCGKKSLGKYINKELFIYDSSILTHLYKTMMLGDGTLKSNIYSTISPVLADDFAQLSILLGNRIRIRKENHGYKNTIYRDKVYRTKRNSFKIKDIREMSWNEDVYCVTLEKNNILIAGREGCYNWVGQSAYGLCGWNRSRFYNRPCAESITAYGRANILNAHNIAEQNGFEVMYADTDSAFLAHKNFENKEELLAEADKLVGQISTDLGIEIKVDEYFKSILFSGKKKRYAALNEHDEVVIRGFESRRGDWSSLSRNTQLEILDIILKEEDIPKAKSYVSSIIKELKAGHVGLDNLIIWKSLTKDLDNYESKQAHVKAAEIAKRFGIEYSIGSKVPYVILKLGNRKVSDKSYPSDLITKFDGKYIYVNGDKFEIDINYYINKQIIPTAVRILEIFDISEEDFQPTKQLGLGEFI